MTLTLEAALALPAGPELDALVAEMVMHRKAYRAENGEYFCNPPAGTFSFVPVAVPPYSTDIAAAWEVVEKQHDRCGFHSIVDGWTANFWVGGEVSLVTESADTAPLAICRAALKACWKD